ncbi:MAG: serine/threonine-protein kinase [Kofleriaceae bacterium]
MTDSFAAGLVGIVLDERYRLDALLGEGGMGAVYRAHHLAMDRRVAIKLLKPHLTQDQTALQRFAREARSTQKVESPHAVKVLDYGVTPHDDYYMVLEYLDGRTVQRELDVDGAFAPKRVLHIAKQALHALGAAHRIGLIHRDIKPDNLLLMRVGDDPDFTKVLDFGVAKLMEGAAKSSRSALSLTQAGMVFGTPEFMSPEQACGQPLDPRSDLYSLAATMFAMLTGCGMYQAGSAIEWLTAHARTPAPHLVDGNPNLAGYGALDAMMQRCFAKHPVDRPRDADEMIAAIEELERELGVDVAPVTKPPKAVSVFSPSGFIASLPPELAPPAELARSSASTLAPTVPSVEEPVGLGTSETGTITPQSRHGTWLALGALAVAGVIVVAIVIAAGKHATPALAATTVDGATPALAATTADAVGADAAVIAVRPPDARTVPPDAARVVAEMPVAHPVLLGGRKAQIELHLANALAAQQAGKHMTQVTQAHAAYLLDPKNPRAVLLLADGLLAEGDLEHGCKYLRELPRNPVAQQRMRSASCPAD